MFEYFTSTFLAPRGEQWFRLGLVIESARRQSSEAGFARLREVLPGVEFDLLSRNEPPGTPFRHIFRVKRSLGGLRLLLHVRKHYELVVFFGTGEHELRLCRAFALLFMRPRRFFVLNEFSEGFWLNQENWLQLKDHFRRRYDWDVRRERMLRWRRRVVARLRSQGRKLKRGLIWLALLPGRTVLLLYAVALFIPAILVMAIMRLTYDTYYYRFRFSAKSAPAPRRDLSARAGAGGEAGCSTVLPAGHIPSPARSPNPPRHPAAAVADVPAKPQKLTITGACDGFSWTPGLIQLGNGNYVSFWVAGLPPTAGCGDVRATLDGIELNVEYLAPARPGPRQVNARLPQEVLPGKYNLVVRVGKCQSPPMQITLEANDQAVRS